MNQFLPSQPGNYRGALVYLQEDGYTAIAITVSVAPEEYSNVTTHAYHLPIAEEAEHRESVDLYHFSVTDGTSIQLTVTSQMGVVEAWYMVSCHTVLALVSPLYLRIVLASASNPPIHGGIFPIGRVPLSDITRSLSPVSCQEES